ncbi:MAG: hypothetical protein GXP25_02120 [Planctomycetes bacterium]|nr:hypothetical protein [Planctomycetota bacterium]
MRGAPEHVRRVWIAAGVFCCLAACAAEAQVAQGLTINRLRAVSYIFGPARQTTEVQPFEKLVLLYDMHHVALDAAGQASLMLNMVWKGPNGREVARFSNPLKAAHVFEGPIPGYGTVTFPGNAPPGVYTMNLLVEDKNSGATATASYSVTLTPPQFDVVNVRFVLGSKDGPERPNTFYVTDKMCVLMDAVGFSTTGDRVNLSMDVVVLEAGGKELHSFKDMVKLDQAFPPGGQRKAGFSLWLNLTRPGRFVAVVTIKDGGGGQIVTKKIPFEVLAAN